MKNDFLNALRDLAPDGISAFQAAHPLAGLPLLSHMCFKFQSHAAFQAGVVEVEQFGPVVHKAFGGKDIVWCRLDQPAEASGLRLEWLELVAPQADDTVQGLTAIAYAVPGLPDTIKIPAAKAGIIFRYQSRHASELIL